MRTSEGKLVLFDLVTGKQGEFWPIDAKALMACGSHGPNAPAGAKVVPPVMPPKHVGMPVTPKPIGAAAPGDSPTDTLTGAQPAVDGEPKRGRRKQEPDAGKE